MAAVAELDSTRLNVVVVVVIVLAVFVLRNAFRLLNLAVQFTHSLVCVQCVSLLLKYGD